MPPRIASRRRLLTVSHVVEDADVAQGFPGDAQAQGRAQVVPVAGRAEMRLQLHGADMFRWIEVLRRHVLRQKERRLPLTAGLAAGEHQAVPCIIL